MTKKLAILNLVTAIGINLWNIYVMRFGLFGNWVGDLANQHDTLFTPANYAFSIWGFIFIGLVGFSLFHVWRAFLSKKDDSFVRDIGPWFSISNLLNGAWLIVWLAEWPLVSVFVMFLLLFSLIRLLLILKRGKNYNWKMVLFQYLPIGLYAGWITVATIANTATYIGMIGFDGGALGPDSWTQIMIALLTIINVYIVLKHHSSIFAFTGIWGLLGIYIKHSTTNSAITLACLIGMITIAAAILLDAKKHWQKQQVTLQ